MDSGELIAANLARIIADRETNNRAVAEAAGLGHTAVRDIITRKVKNPTYATLLKLAEVLHVPVSDIIGLSAPNPPHPVAVAGRVGAGARVPLFDAFAKGDGLYHVARPPQLPNSSVVAVEVEGDSMAPMYQPGHVLFFSRNTHEGIPEEDIGRPCVVEDINGMAWVKMVKRGSEPGKWNLISLNPDAESVWDVPIRWAARVRLALPAELVERIA